jgi:hypothetical protein
VYDATVSVTGNNISDVGAEGIDIYLGYDDAVIDVASNTINDAETGIALTLYDVYNATTTITGNVITDVERDGIDVYFDNADSGQITVAGNQISGSAIHPDPQDCEGCGIGFDLYNDSDDNVIVINGNTIAHSDDTGIGALVEDGSSGNALEISGNQVDQSDLYGVYLYTNDASNTLASQTDNEVTNSGVADWVINGFTGTILVNGVAVP